MSLQFGLQAAVWIFYEFNAHTVHYYSSVEIKHLILPPLQRNPECVGSVVLGLA